MGGPAGLIEIRPGAGTERYGPAVARRGELIEVAGLPGFVASVDGERAGMVAYAIRADECEVVTLESVRQGIGVGRALMDAVRHEAERAGCRRLWVVTTNDNTRALAFYQRWGMDLCAFRRDAVHEARRTLKPAIPETGEAGIPIAHELELERLLAPDVQDPHRP